METDQRPLRVDLSDPEAICFCLCCGSPYRQTVETCGSCGEAALATRDELLSAVRSSLEDPALAGIETAILVELSRPQDAAQTSALTTELREGGLPFLLLDESGRPLPAQRVDAARVVLGPAGGTDGQELAYFDAVGPDQLVHVQSRLDERGIEYSVHQAPHEFGLQVGDFAKIRIYVQRADLERARAALQAMEDLSTPAQGPTRSETETAEFRLQRRYKITRLFSWPVGIANIVYGFFLLGEPAAWSWIPILLGVAYVVLVVWSGKQPEKAFGMMLLIALASIIWGMVVSTPLIFFPSGVGLLAVLYAYEASVKAAKAKEAEQS